MRLDEGERRGPDLRRRPAPAGDPRGAGGRCASAALRRPSSSPASRCCAGRRWSPRSSPPGTGWSCTATATATCCGSAPGAFLEDADRARAAIEEAGGQAISDYRPPYGIFSAATLRAVRGVAGGRCSGRGGGRDWIARATAESIARRSSAGIAAGDIVLLHDADYYSARGSWVRTAAALPLILDEIEARGLKIGLAAPLSRRGEGPLLAAGKRFVEALRHRAPRPILIEDFPRHDSPSCRGRYVNASAPDRTKNMQVAKKNAQLAWFWPELPDEVGDLVGEAGGLIERDEGARVRDPDQIRAFGGLRSRGVRRRRSGRTCHPAPRRAASAAPSRATARPPPACSACSSRR